MQMHRLFRILPHIPTALALECRFGLLGTAAVERTTSDFFFVLPPAQKPTTSMATIIRVGNLLLHGMSLDR
ncbi:hypothetical protein K440DRAFT_627072 [Wilcoxina mikolae CBS 423.85]|nr:hypothetical protein K440DRAFT_627072 [Wilcoxina mikolae CBS 423.85]